MCLNLPEMCLYMSLHNAYCAGSDLEWTFTFITTQTSPNSPDLLICRTQSGPDYLFGLTAPVMSALLAEAGRTSSTEPPGWTLFQQLQQEKSKRKPNLPAGPLFSVISETLDAPCADPFMMSEKFYFLFPKQLKSFLKRAELRLLLLMLPGPERTRHCPLTDTTGTLSKCTAVTGRLTHLRESVLANSSPYCII